jgi:general secretion pathway protein E
VVDVRVSTVPTAKGERVVMRLLDKQQVLLDLPDLGFDGDQLHRMDALIRRPNGIILVTGPTGSGKTTTLYACLNKINTPEKNILTVEDPVEYELKGIGQVHVRPKIGLTFASGLRSFLRQDPDVIMVGEIRDTETAEIAIHASLTGHLVFSTLHTNDAPGAVTRLVEMEIQPFLIASSLMAVLAQRLVRRLCPLCRVPYRPSDEDLRSLGLDPDNLEQELDQLRRAIQAMPQTSQRPEGPDNGGPVFYRPGGCAECSHTGYRGRLGIFEMMVVDEPVRREILNMSSAGVIQRVAQQRGMRTLRQDGARQVLAGRTSVDEVLAATQAGELE